MKRILHARLVYQDHLRRPCKTVCDVVQDEIFGDRLCVIFTELNDNTGPSITNSVEDAIIAFCEDRNMFPQQGVFFERYQNHPQDLDQIIFEMSGDRPTNISWKRLDPNLARQILDCIDHE